MNKVIPVEDERFWCPEGCGKTLKHKMYRSEFELICTDCNYECSESELKCDCCDKTTEKLREGSCEETCYNPTPYEIDYDADSIHDQQKREDDARKLK